MVLFSNARGTEHGTTAVRSSPGMSVQPDIPILISAPPPSRDVGFLDHAEASPLCVVFFVGGRDRTSCFSGSYNLFSPPLSLAKARWRIFFLCKDPVLKARNWAIFFRKGYHIDCPHYDLFFSAL
jgi:hypothetical protein